MTYSNAVDLAVPSEDADEQYVDLADSADGSADVSDCAEVGKSARQARRRTRVKRRLAPTARILLPLCVFAVTLCAAYFKYTASTASATSVAETDALAAAREITVAMLAYQPNTVEDALANASERLTGDFQDDYTGLMKDVVIPGAKAGNVTTAASVPAAAVISAKPDGVVALLYVNQHVTAGNGPPTDTATTVKVTVVKRDGTWFVSGFEPV